MEKKNKTIAIRLDQKMYEELKETAEYNCIPLSQLVRHMLTKALKELDVEEELIYETISRI